MPGFQRMKIIRCNWIDQSHRYGRPQAACREPARSYDKTTRSAICFDHKTQYLLNRAPYTRLVVFWHISNIPPMISQSQISCNTAPPPPPPPPFSACRLSFWPPKLTKSIIYRAVHPYWFWPRIPPLYSRVGANSIISTRLQLHRGVSLTFRELFKIISREYV